jgi:hypothetical protein
MLYDKRWDEKLPQVDDIGRDLLAAADYIEEHGWCQGRPYLGESACVIGAVNIVTNGDKRLFETDRLRHAMERVHKTLGGSAISWNDNPTRTKEEVVSALRKAAYLG